LVREICWAGVFFCWRKHVGLCVFFLVARGLGVYERLLVGENELARRRMHDEHSRLELLANHLQ
jgi:hypothetical protein